MVRKAGHGERLTLLGSAGEGQAEQLGSDFGILAVQLVKVTHAKQKQHVWMPLLHFFVRLAIHRSPFWMRVEAASASCRCR
jgi:hypothetical protein